MAKNTTESIHAGFWRRVFAFIIDGMLIGIISLILSFILKDVFLNLGENLWYIGFVILGLYFITLNSSIGKGQTLGKKILKIRVVHEKGEFLTIPQSSFRYFILSLVIFSSGIGMSLTSLFGFFQIIPTIFTIIAVFIFFGVIGLLIFNKDKRGLHDYLVKTIVIKSQNPDDINVPKMDNFKEAFLNHKIAFILTISLFIIITAAIIVVPKLLVGATIAGADFSAMLDLKLNLEKDYSVSNVGVQSQVYQSWGSDGEVQKSTNLIVSGYLKYPIYKDEDAKTQLYEQINSKVVSTYPNIENYDNVVIEFRTGYNLGIANFWMRESDSFLITN